MEAYPHGPGWQGTATSKEAAERIGPRLGRLYRVTMTALLDGPKTADEVTQWAKGWIRTYSARLSERGRWAWWSRPGSGGQARPRNRRWCGR